MFCQDVDADQGDRKGKEKKSAIFTSALLEFANGLAKKGKKKTPFTEHIQALLICQDTEYGPHKIQESVDELRSLVVQLDEKHKKTSKTRRTIDFLNPFFSGIARYSNVVDTLVSSNAVISGLVWGGFKFVLQLAGEYAQYYEDLTNTLESLAPWLSHLGQLSEIFDWSEELSTLLTKSYEDILLILEVSADAYSQSGLKTLLKGTFMPLDRHSKHLKGRLEKNMQSVRDGSLAALSYVTRKIAEDNRKKSINEWLQAPATDPIYDHCHTIKHPMTCQWLFSHSTYQSWEEASNKDSNECVLWIYGATGIGKTFLASSVIEKLKSEGNNYEVIYYYFHDQKSGNPLQPGNDKALTMIRNLLRQLVDITYYKSKHDLPNDFWEIYDKSGGASLSDIDLGIKAFQVLLAIRPRIHIVIDGLDECTDRLTTTNSHTPAWKSNKLLPTILEKLIASKHHGIVKWCFTGCRESELIDLFRRLETPTLEVTVNHVEEDVFNYTADTINSNALGIEMDDEAFSQISELINANFLNARLTLELLRESSFATSEVLWGLLWGYKEGFNSRYLRSIRAFVSRPKIEKELTKRILNFAATAERSLTRAELLDALGIQPGVHEYSSNYRPTLERLDELLAPLLELDRSTSLSNPTIRFIHRTAREFLQQDSDKIQSLPADCKEFFPDLKQRHLEFGKICLTYLRRESFGYSSTVEMEKALCNNMDQDSNSFLKYASIFWHHHLGHLDVSSVPNDLFQQISLFMHSTNFLTCLWIQSKYAPYLITHYTTEDNMKGYRIENPTSVFAPTPNSKLYYSDPLPGWLAEYNEEGTRLVQGCQLLIKEFGLVLLRRRGGIRHFHPCLLGTLNFLPVENTADWKVLALEIVGDIQPDGATLPEKQKDLLSVNLTSRKEVTVRTIVVKPDTDFSATLSIKEWEIQLTRRRNKALKLNKTTILPLPMDPSLQEFFESGSDHQSDMFTFNENNNLVISFGSKLMDLVKMNFEGPSVVPSGFGVPEKLLSSKTYSKQFTFRGRGYATDGTVSAVSYHWSIKNLLDASKEARKITNIATKYTPNDSDSDYDSDDPDSDSETDARPYNSGYSSATSADTLDQVKTSSWHTSIGIQGINDDCQWHHFDVEGPSLRQVAPFVHPSKPFIFLPLDGSRTAVINYLTGDRREINVPNEKHAITCSRIYHSSQTNDRHFELKTTREQGSVWIIHLNVVVFDIESSNDINKISIEQREISSVSWSSPYANPFEDVEHPALPFKVTWTDKYVYIVFGACEVYLVRMLLEDSENQENRGNLESNSPELARVETTNEPAFLPASTTERFFTFIPQNMGKKEYGIFVISGSAVLPPVLIRQDINADLGGWIASRHIGRDDSEEDKDMRGKYSRNYHTFIVPIRSGLAWKDRIVVECW